MSRERRMGLPLETPLVGQPLYQNAEKSDERKDYEARVSADSTAERDAAVERIRSWAVGVDVQKEGPLGIRLVGTRSALDNTLREMGVT